MYWKEGSEVTAANGTKIAGARSGGEITGLTNDKAYSVLVRANKVGFTSIDSDVKTATPSEIIRYSITGSGTAFTARKGGAAVGEAEKPIQDVITAIRTDAAGKAVNIQFGDGTAALETGTAALAFNNTGGAWGAVTLSGKLTSTLSGTTGTISIGGDVSVTSTADITNNSGRPINNASTGTLNITEGTILTVYSTAVYNSSTGKIIVSGTAKVTSQSTNTSSGTIHIASSGTATEDRLIIEGGSVENTNPAGFYAITSASTGGIRISGGTVSATGGRAVHSTSVGKITVSGTALLTSGNINTAGGVVYLAAISGVTSTAERLVIEGGTIRNTAVGNAVYNASTGTVTMSGGTVENTSETTGNAIYNNSTGAINITGGTVSKTGTGGNAIFNNSTGVVTITKPPAVITGNVSGVPGYTP